MPHKMQDKVVTFSQIKQIFGDDFSLFKKIKSNVYCDKCSGDHITTIIEYTAYLTANYDLLLKGKCKNCKNPVARILETGEVKKYREIANTLT